MAPASSLGPVAASSRRPDSTPRIKTGFDTAVWSCCFEGLIPAWSRRRVAGVGLEGSLARGGAGLGSELAAASELWGMIHRTGEIPAIEGGGDGRRSFVGCEELLLLWSRT